MVDHLENGAKDGQRGPSGYSTMFAEEQMRSDFELETGKLMTEWPPSR